MQIDLRNSTVHLAHEGLLAIRDGQSTRLRCVKGSVWITQEGDMNDVVLAAGEAFTLVHPGLTVITALEASLLEIEEPAPARQPVRAAVAEQQAAACT